MTTTRTSFASHPANRFMPDFLGRVSSRVTAYVSSARAERQLDALDDRLLADIGMRRSEIEKMVWGR